MLNAAHSAVVTDSPLKRDRNVCLIAQYFHISITDEVEI